MSRRHHRIGEPGLDAYRLLTALVLPRPIAWISTIGPDGVGNLAPHSFFNIVSAEPPMVMFATVGRKDTIVNVETTGEFTVSLASEPMAEVINASAARFAPDVDEADVLGLAMAPASVVAPPYVAEAPAHLECRVHRIVELPASYVVIGEVVHASVDEDVLTDGLPDVNKIRPLSRLGETLWGLSPAAVHHDRPGPPEGRPPESD